MQTAPLYLKKREERRLRGGHPWLFSNEIDIGRSPLKSFLPGQLVQVRTHGNEVVGHGYMNPNSLIAVRLLERGEAFTDLDTLLETRVRSALALREQLFDAPYYRLIYGEGDALPGLVVDRYGDHLVVQISTAGMDQMTEMALDVLQRVIKPAGILLRNDVSSREQEGLERFVRVASGDVPDTLEVVENGTRFDVAPVTGQKTGWYYDHRENRAWLQNKVTGASVLDLFSYVGGWGIECAVGGATKVLAVDSGEAQLEAVMANAAKNNVGDRVSTRRGDAMNLVKDLRREGQQFDVVVVDPPAFVKRKKDATAGTEAYRRLNGIAMQLVKDGGLLVSASCSFHFSRDKHIETIARVARGNSQHAQILSEGRQSPDHPVHPALPEMHYLKTLFVRVSKA
jgi:23S rRNA (cytosine1962-C5)-methyltransferase